LILLSNSESTDISVLKDLKKLEILNLKIENLELKSNQIKYIRDFNILMCKKDLKITVLKQLNKNIMNKTIISLSQLKLKTFTEQDALDYCLLNSINPDNITELNLNNNELTDISGIKYLTNLKYLDISFNQIKDISVLKDLNRLEYLNIRDNQIKDISILSNLNNLKYLNIIDLELKSDQIEYINSCKKLKELYCTEGFKNNFLKEKINKNIIKYN